MQITDVSGISCPIERSIAVLGDRWTLLVLREASFGTRRFSRFRELLGVASDVLATRLATLVDLGLLERVAYREEGRRTREEYQLTPSGRDFQLVLASLGTWGREHLRAEADSGVRYVDRDGHRARVSFIDERDHPLDTGDVEVRLPGA